ncbi:hypothetical protein ACF3MZ_09775 [Paenibacillaceae bacterium WGS1546]|uniref:hypothetical protein n=1 Tax=Cohnella sp. WGS1546 TaxID=3366810 RepID=UPI00372D0C50
MEANKFNGIKFYPPQEDYLAFDDDEDYAEMGRAWGMFGKTPKTRFWYKNAHTQVQVEIKGYQEFRNMSVLVVEFDGGQLSCIHPSYLKEMQSGTFGKEIAVDETDAAEIASAAAANADELDEDGAEKPAKAVKAKKKQAEKKPKLDLPADKVKFKAKVKEFATKPNPFADRDDEVLLLENVEIVGDSPLAVGEAWCGYSNTLKALGLEVGNELEFDGKIVDKKFNKEILYKVNNPSKITIK